MNNLHVLKERLPVLLLRSQVSDAEYEHLKECPTCLETMALSTVKVPSREVVVLKTNEPDSRQRKRT
jgi:hypothetical protein